MIWTSPLWLLLLFPWAGVAIWALRGRASAAAVTHLPLWDHASPLPTATRARRLPPFFVILLLLAALACLLAAAGPAIRSSRGMAVTLIVDRSLLTAAALRKAPLSAAAVFGDNQPGAVRWVEVPGATSSKTRDEAIEDLAQLRPTALNTNGMLHQIIAREQAAGAEAIVVITAGAIEVAGVRVVPPTASLQNAGIETLSVSTEGKPAAMVRIWNGTEQRSATLIVGNVTSPIELSPAGESRNFFVELPSLEESVSARLVIDDDIAADNTAYIARRSGRARLEARTALPPDLDRMIAIYTQQNPPTTLQVAVVGQGEFDTGSFSAAHIVSGRSQAIEVARLQIDLSHAVGRDVDWQSVLTGARATALPSMPGAKVLIRQDEKIFLAASDSPARRVWSGLDVPQWSTQSDFVVFWTNIFDFLTGDSLSYSAQPVRSIPADWTPIVSDPSVDASPGLYRTPEGTVALSVSVVKPLPLPASVPTPLSPKPEVIPLAPWLLVASLIALVAGVLSAPNDFRRRKPSGLVAQATRPVSAMVSQGNI
ncbi:MAG TPA: hypothetical protein VGB55_11085 [Tepidisphaeraceae bacterium]